MSQSIKVSEIFGPTIQGEGALIGKPTVFVRTGGCDYRCTWCDSLHAVDSAYRDEWRAMQAEDILSEIKKLSDNKPLIITLSGGNPAIQPLLPLIQIGRKIGYSFAMETQGSVPKPWFNELEHLILSPKPPSSHEAVNWEKFQECLNNAGQKTSVILKIVVFNEDDYIWSRDVSKRFPALPVYLQAGNHTPPSEEDETIDINGILNRMDWLVERSLKDRWFNVHILPQLHVLLWGNKRGV